MMAQDNPEGFGEGDIPADFKPVTVFDHVRRETMVPMRDGIRLHTVLLIPQGTSKAPIVLDRTPYNATKSTRLSSTPRAALALYALHGDLVDAGYIVAIQDVRGRHKSEGAFTMNTPPRGPLNPGPTDDATDAFDTIEWLVTAVPECSGRVGTIGISYDGFTALMSLLEPHPALRACVPINPMVDNWMGDDWFHNGAFRQTATIQYVYQVTAHKQSDHPWPSLGDDEHERWLEAGSAGAMARSLGMESLPFWRRLTEHPAYDAFWQGQAVDRLLARKPSMVPTLHVHSQWDAEDSHGSPAAYAAMRAAEGGAERAFIAIGPWSHTSVGFDDGSSLGVLRFGSATAARFRRELLVPFLDAQLREQEPMPAPIPSVSAFETGSNVWRTFGTWPPSADTTAVYLGDHHALSFEAPASSEDDAFDAFVSDPSKPVTYQPRPIRPKGSVNARWDNWLVDDQRFAADRPDVLVYTSHVLTKPVRIAGQPVARLYASTTGSDADWIVKLIDVFPDEVRGLDTLGGYQLPIAMEILRGRYRDDTARPSPIPPDEVVPYTIRLPHVCHAFLPGHRLMVQVQSTWFPLYDRNPQRFVPNIFFAGPGDFTRATHRVYRSVAAPSRIELPVGG